MWYTNGTKYDADNRVTEVKYDDSDTHKVNLTYDLLNRITNKTVTNGVPYSTNYTYVAGNTAGYGANATTSLIETITQGSGENAMNFAYTYDSRGNITSETRNGVTTTYEYDELGQLIRVNDPNDPAADSVRGTTWVYNYDRGGNILQKLAYVLSSDAQPSELRQSLLYEYTDANWKDKLTVFCNDEREYDAIGNLTDDGQWTYTWEKGRQLKSMHNPYTGVTMEFRYNHEGIRTQKVKKVNGVVTETTDYILKGKQIAAMKKNTDEYYFTYDASGKPATVNFNGTNYTYVKNLQGDIVGILDASGNMVVEYKYDAWGDAVSIYSASTTVDDLAFDNPFRYRGYIWDEETKLYYLTSRYYNPEISRFINADSLVSTGQGILSNNMLAYCRNNPVCRKDVTGNAEEDIKQDNSNPITLNEGKIHTGGNVGDGGFGGSSGGKGNSSSSGNNDFWIYRYGYNNASKLVPSEKDMKENSGVSFSLKARPGSAVTTMKAIDGTGVLKAVRDGAYHVSVYPLGGTIKQWYEWGGNSIWTKALESVVIKN